MKRALLFLAILVVLGLGYYLISPLFISKHLDEAVPVSQLQQKESGSYEVIGSPGHPATGAVRIIKTEEADYIRYENFKTINGPDIYVYLANDLDAKDFINLGKVKATEGSVNYMIPKEVNPYEYKYVLTWCKRFGVLFNYAEIKKL